MHKLSITTRGSREQFNQMLLALKRQGLESMISDAGGGTIVGELEVDLVHEGIEVIAPTAAPPTDGPTTAGGQPKPAVFDQCVGRDEPRPTVDNFRLGKDDYLSEEEVSRKAVNTAVSIMDDAGENTTPFEAYSVACELHRRHRLSRPLRRVDA